MFGSIAKILACITKALHEKALNWNPAPYSITQIGRHVNTVIRKLCTTWISHLVFGVTVKRDEIELLLNARW